MSVKGNRLGGGGKKKVEVNWKLRTSGFCLL